MKFSIVTTPSEDGWKVEITSSEKPDFKIAARDLKRCGEKGDGYPLPSPGDAAVWDEMIHASLCAPPGDDPAPIQSVYEDIIFRGDPGPDGVEKFGRYLSAVLLGSNWDALENASNKESIELNLQFNAEDVEMHRLPWEMMFGTERPLAAHLTRDVSINRIVSGKVATTKAITLPLKLLFVIGRQLDDALRPGAEYLGMLRRMKVKFGTDVRNMDLNVRLCTETTTDELQAAINDFKPDVVHFICHGDIAEDKKGRLLLTKRETEDVTSKKTQEPDYCDAQRLLALLRQDEVPHELPQIIVLNACHTADAGGVPDIQGGYQSLAATLVSEGVPIVIGMTGEVADGACRIFTRKFYEALLTESRITLASARGRRAAMIYFTDNYKTSVEWARPTLFMAKDVSTAVELDGNSVGRKLSEVPSKYIKNPMALCDRFTPLQVYQKYRHEAIKSGSPKLLAFKVDEPEVDANRFGKTRLLEEIAAHAVMDGFIPCTVLSRPSKTFEPSPNLLSLAIRVADSMDEARDHFSIPKRHLSTALDLACNVLGLAQPVAPDPKNTTMFEWEKDKVVKAITKLGHTDQPPEPGFAVVRASMLADFRKLQADIEAETGEKRIPLLALDDLQRYEGVADVLLHNVIDGHGLGDQDLVVPMVFTYSSVGVAGGGLQAITDFINGSGKYLFGNVPLQRISDLNEEKLAYCQYLLSREQPLAVNWRSEKKDDVQGLFELMRTTIKGVPSMFNDRELQGALKLAKQFKVLLDADDERIFESLV